MDTVGNALFANFATLKPFAGFAAKYQFLNARYNPIALPGGLDPRAGEPGYDPNLNAGLAVPMGSRVVIWLPRLNKTQYNTTDSPTYEYTLVWRIRTLQDQVADGSDRLVGHFGATLPGVPQGASPIPDLDSAGPRIVIPTAFQSVTMPAAAEGPFSTWPVTVQTAAFLVEGYNNAYGAPLSSLYPSTYSTPKVGAAAMLGQGLYSLGNGTPNPTEVEAGYGGGPQYSAVETRALGDELIVLLSRGAAPDPFWNFETIDSGLAALLGSPQSNIGIYVSTGAFST